MSLRSGNKVLMFLFLALCGEVSAQQNIEIQKKGNFFFQEAHDKRIKIEDFRSTDKGLFRTKVFTIESAVANNTHHWFIQVLSNKNRYVNFATVNIKGHHLDDPKIDFRFMNPVIKMCQEGKYTIAFVNVVKSGTYVLDITIDNFGKTDHTQAIIEIL